MSIMANTVVLNVADQQEERLGHYPRKAIFGCLAIILCIKFKTTAKEGKGKVAPKEDEDSARTGDVDPGRKIIRSQGCMSNDDPQPETDEHELWQKERTTAADILDRWFFVVFLFMIVLCTLLTVVSYE